MSQSLARLWTHLIFSTKNRFPFFIDKKLRTDMHAYLAKMLREQDCETLIVNGVEDHVHALFCIIEDTFYCVSRQGDQTHLVWFCKGAFSDTGKVPLAGWIRSLLCESIQFGGSCYIYRKPGRASQASDFSGRVPRFLEGVRH